MADQNPTIRFRCTNCHCKIKTAPSNAGKNTKCPKCKTHLKIPEQSQSAGTGRDNNVTNRQQSTLDHRLFETPLAHEPSHEMPAEEPQTPSTLIGTSTYTHQETARTESPRKRKYPWILDIFLYPAAAPGMSTLGVIVGLPFVLYLLHQLALAMTASFGPMIVFAILLLIARIIIELICAAYAVWYACECIRDSALGGVRAPETVAVTPDLADIFLKILTIAATFVIFALPAVLYFMNARKIDQTFYALAALGAFLLPMGLLAVTMFDTIKALNPLIIAGSVISTFIPYCGLVLFYYLLVGLGVFTGTLVGYLLAGTQLAAHFAKFTGLYQLMIASHILGCFYKRYQQKLNWDV